MKRINLGLFLLFIVLLLNSTISFAADTDKIPISTISDEAKKQFEKGRDLFEKLQVTESLPYFENAFKLDNSFAFAYFYHAQANANASGFFEDLENAVKYSTKASEGEKLLISNLQHQANGNIKSQEESLQKLIELYPNDERAHTFIGTFYFGQQKYLKAIEHLEKSKAIAPEYSAPYNMLGYAYKNMGKYPEAEEVFRKYTELLPNDPNPYDSYAELLMKEGKYSESIKQYRKALEIDPLFQASYIGISNNLNYMGKHIEARKELDNFYDKARNDGERRAALFARVISYADQGKFNEALEEMQNEFEIARKADDKPNMSADLNAMGNILFEMGKYDDAQNKFNGSLKKILAADVSDQVKENAKRLALYNDARIQLKTGKLDAAKQAAKEFNDKSGAANNTFQIWLACELNGLIALEEKDYKQAIEEFNKGNKQNPFTYYYIGLAYQGMKNNYKAEQNFKLAESFNALNNLNQSFVRYWVNKAI